MLDQDFHIYLLSVNPLPSFDKFSSNNKNILIELMESTFKLTLDPYFALLNSQKEIEFTRREFT